MTPSREVGPAWRDWQQPGLTEEFDAIAAGEVAGLIPDYDASIRTFGRMTPRRLAALAVAETERQAALAPDGIGVPLARSMRRAALAGSGGWLDDAIAEASDWGFRVGDIRVPVVVRHGELDRLVPIPNGRWLARAIPGAIGDFRPDRGHSSIALPWTDVVDSLVSAAGSRLFGDRATT
jgi:pimeloyl-ACP methyl ester carboxylesterase